MKPASKTLGPIATNQTVMSNRMYLDGGVRSRGDSTLSSLSHIEFIAFGPRCTSSNKSDTLRLYVVRQFGQIGTPS